MSNEETLQELNERLEENNVSLANVLETINNLPSSGGGSTDIYSTEETVIGTWLGKPLYRKVVEYGTLNNEKGTKNVAHGISDIDTITDIKAIGCENDYFFNIPFVPTARMFANVSYTLRVNKTEIGIYVSEDRSMQTAIVTLEYTKKTD